MNGQTTAALEPWLYAGACVLLPVAWGLAMVWVTNRIERLVSRRLSHHEESGGTPAPPPTVEYHI